MVPLRSSTSCGRLSCKNPAPRLRQFTTSRSHYGLSTKTQLPVKPSRSRKPTTGLHLADVEQLLGLLDRLVDSGKSVIVIEHHQAVMAHADWIIDLGPGAGHDGGRIIFEGTPADLVAARSTLTGEHLARYVTGGDR